jgi:diamine N-acetyltransferase
MKNVFLAGTGIYLRPVERADSTQFVKWVNDAEVTRTLLLHRPVTHEAEEEYLMTIAKSDASVVLGIVARESDQLVGIAGLHQIEAKDRHATFGIFIGEKSEWGKGYCTEATALMVGYAFDTLNLHRVALHVVEHNVAAIRSYLKVGFQQEGVLREAMFREGRYHNLLTMGILRDEWRALQPPR